MREPQELTTFTTVPTPVGEESAGLLWVPERMVEAGNVPALGTALKDFMVRADKADALSRGFGEYVFTQQGGMADGWRSFYFAKLRSAEEIAAPYRTLTGVRSGIPWPAVFGSMATGNLLAYDESGTSYIEGTVWKPTWARKYYDGPVDTVEEWWASHTPFTIPVAAGMQPRSEVFDYGVGSFTLPECLHGALTLTYVIAESTRRPAQSASMTFDATNLTDWPDYIVLQDGQTFEDGLYIRRRLKALKPA